MASENVPVPPPEPAADLEHLQEDELDHEGLDVYQAAIRFVALARPDGDSGRGTGTGSGTNRQ